MDRRHLFWGSLILLIGLVFLATSFGWFKGVNVWNLIWPLCLVALGVWFILGTLFNKNKPLDSHTESIELGDTSDAEIVLKYGAGKLIVGSTEVKGVLLDGSYLGEIEKKVAREGGHTRIVLQTSENLIFTFPGMSRTTGLNWTLRLAKKVPMKLKVESGASDTLLDLTDLNVTELKVETGASSNRILLPAKAGKTSVKVSSGAASIDIKVPEGVAGKIKLSTALSGNKVDNGRFPWNGTVYESPDYEKAKNKVEILVESGVGSVDIK